MYIFDYIFDYFGLIFEEKRLKQVEGDLPKALILLYTFLI